ncbi:MAG: Crp/Fnr family transcriptional regulator [Pyrinomonadaceae bacterium]
MAFGETTRVSNTESYSNSAYVPYIERARTQRPISTSQLLTNDHGNTILDSLKREMAAMIEPYLQTVELDQEQVLFQEEDDLDVVYFPLTAVISEFRSLEDGRMVEIAVTGNEGAIGLSSVLSGSGIAHNYTQVSQAGTVRTIRVSHLEHLLHSNEALRYSLGRHTDVYIRQISQKAICNMYHCVKERLCTWLLMVQDRSGSKKMSLTHEQMSRILGVNRPSVSRMAHELQESNLIRYSRGGVTIQDRERVENAACACYFELGGPAGALLN